jgi:hypothetical protein
MPNKLDERKVEQEEPTLEDQVLTVMALSNSRRLIELSTEAIYSEDGISNEQVQELYNLIHKLHQTGVRSSEVSFTQSESAAISELKQELTERGAEPNNRL